MLHKINTACYLTLSRNMWGPFTGMYRSGHLRLTNTNLVSFSLWDLSFVKSAVSGKTREGWSVLKIFYNLQNKFLGLTWIVYFYWFSKITVNVINVLLVTMSFISLFKLSIWALKCAAVCEYVSNIYIKNSIMCFYQRWITPEIDIEEKAY